MEALGKSSSMVMLFVLTLLCMVGSCPASSDLAEREFELAERSIEARNWFPTDPLVDVPEYRERIDRAASMGHPTASALLVSCVLATEHCALPSGDLQQLISTVFESHDKKAMRILWSNLRVEHRGGTELMLDLLEESVTLGHDDAQVQLAQFKLGGKYYGYDKDGALELLWKAARQNNAEAYELLGGLMLNRNGDNVESLFLYRQAVRHTQPGDFMLSHRKKLVRDLEDGTTIKELNQSPEEIVAEQRRIAYEQGCGGQELGAFISLRALAAAFGFDDPHVSGYVKGMEDLAREGCVDAMKGMRRLTMKGNQDTDHSTYWLKMAAESNDASAQYELGALYSHSSSPADQQRAVRWIREAAKRGHRDAAKYIAEYDSNTQGASQGPSAGQVIAALIGAAIISCGISDCLSGPTSGVSYDSQNAGDAAYEEQQRYIAASLHYMGQKGY